MVDDPPRPSHTLDELAALAGVSRRTVRFYVEFGLLDRPYGVGRGPHYGSRHIDQLLSIRAWRQAGFTLDRIRALLISGVAAPAVPLLPGQGQDVDGWRHLTTIDGVKVLLDPMRAKLNPQQMSTLARHVKIIINGVGSEWAGYAGAHGETLMIAADIKGKTHVQEDVLTSNIFGLLRLLPDIQLLSLLSHAKNLEGETLDFGSDDWSGVRAEIEFWPWLRQGGQPDVIVKIVGSKYVLWVVIEVKHGAPKSSGESDQLGRYLHAAKKQYLGERVVLLYLTHHNSLPREELEETQNESGLGADSLYWLSWHGVAEWAQQRAVSPLNGTTETRICNEMVDYLRFKGYQRFRGWESPALDNPIPSDFQPYQRIYFWNRPANKPRPILPAMHSFYRRHHLWSWSRSVPTTSLLRAFYQQPE